MLLRDELGVDAVESTPPHVPQEGVGPDASAAVAMPSAPGPPHLRKGLSREDWDIQDVATRWLQHRRTGDAAGTRLLQH